MTEPRPNLRLVDDTYNASVASVKAAIDLLAGFDGQRWFVLGDMAELGDDSAALHQEVAEYAHARRLDKVLTFGKASQIVSTLNNGQHFNDKTALIETLHQQLDPLLNEDNIQVTVLAKGARSSRMEDVIVALQEHKE